MLKTIKNAGFSAREFGRLVGVSRVAVHNWTSDPPRSKPHSLLSDKVEAALRLMAELVAKKELPLKDGLDREQRDAAIDKLKARVLRSLN